MPVLPQALMFRSSDGSLAAAGVDMLALGVFLIVVSLGEVVGAAYWSRRSSTTTFRPLQIALGLWGALGTAVGVFFVSWPFIASPGVLY